MTIKSENELVVSPSGDKGIVARERLTATANKVSRVAGIAWSYIWIAALTVVMVILIAAWSTHKVKGYNYERTCKIPTDTGINVSGVRKYHTSAIEVFGISLIDTSKASEDTRLLSTMDAITVVGIKDNAWWSVSNPASEPRELILKEADTYVFHQGTRSYVVSYNDFCK